MNLFQLGKITGRSGVTLPWKVECDALGEGDWACLAYWAAELLPPFGEVEGVPRGGLPFADALRPFVREGGGLLIAEDVCTTGGGLEDQRRGRDAVGVVAFARGPVPNWVTPLWTGVGP